MKELNRGILKAVAGNNTYLDLYELYDKYGSCEFAEAFNKILVVFKAEPKRKAVQAYSDILANEIALNSMF